MLSAAPIAYESTPRFPKGLRAMELPAPVAGLKDWSQARCAKCHEDHADAWKHSGHAAARTNFVFQAALRFDEPTWCVRCHAPLAKHADRSVPALDAAAEETGVTGVPRVMRATHGVFVIRSPLQRAPTPSRSTPA